MKTKIIYISGGEIFEMAQIRAAFDEVRDTLGLDNDTVLFGVPVDNDNALPMSENVQAQTKTVCNAIETIAPSQEPEIIPETNNIIEEFIPDETPIDIQPESIDDVISDTAVPDVATDSEPEATPVIPILSILGGDDAANVSIPQENTPEPEIIPEIAPESDDTLHVSITDIVAQDAPVPEQKETLEELLESMTPLVEDEITEPEQSFADEQIIDGQPENFPVSETEDTSDTDATLAQLANEFAQTQDKIPESPKATNSGKIGKLKNILPFKKAKREDNSLMGDLFGWAGIAANDEDFSIPGFFTSAGGQK